jgi:tRNA pseudouridine55 synthase
VAEFLAEANKTYRAAIELGTSTDTYDFSGKVIERCDASGVTREQVEKALASFHGPILQIPPMYSALRRGGKRLYQMARAGVEVPREARRIELLRLELLDWQPPLFTIEVECSKGTYIRSLAHDIGQALGCGAHLRSLVRTKNGPFCLEDSIPLSDLEEAFSHGYWHDLIYPLDFVLTHWNAAILGEASEHALQRGQSLPFAGEDGPSWKDVGHRCRAYSLDGRIFALLRWDPDTSLWHPDKVFK